ncbi:MAG: hypothetical protein IJW36_00800 [Clostridia bacterium]|nr:hypothetical protein [Clostridia bacterium]
MKKKFCSILALLIMVTPLMFAGCEKHNTNSTIQKVDLRAEIVSDKEIKSVSYYGVKTESSSTTKVVNRMCTYKIKRVAISTPYGSGTGTSTESPRDVQIEDFIFIAEEGLTSYYATTIPEFASRLGIVNGKYLGKDVVGIRYELSVVDTYKVDVYFSDSLVHIFYFDAISNQFVSTEDFLENENNQYYEFI